MLNEIWLGLIYLKRLRIALYTPIEQGHNRLVPTHHKVSAALLPNSVYLKLYDARSLFAITPAVPVPKRSRNVQWPLDSRPPSV